MKLWVARDNYKDAYGRGTLTSHLYKPVLNKYGRWVDNTAYGFQCVLPKDEFPEITFENSPQMVELKLVKVTESTIKWQTGTPTTGGEYLVCLKDGSVTTDKFLAVDGLERDWKRFNKSYVVGWYKLSNIVPYKYKED